MTNPPPSPSRPSSVSSSTTSSLLSSSWMVVSEGSLQKILVADPKSSVDQNKKKNLINGIDNDAIVARPKEQPIGFYNPKRRIGRDYVVLSVAHWIKQYQQQKTRKNNSSSSSLFIPTVLDANCATGTQGLRVALESPILANAAADTKHNSTSNKNSTLFNVVLNDVDVQATKLAQQNMETNIPNNNDGCNVSTSNAIAQSLLFTNSYSITILDPFGSSVPYLDAAFVNAPNNGLIEICATDINALYGSRPSIATRHYGYLSDGKNNKKRPPVIFREWGIRILLATMAQSAGRFDKGIVPLYVVSLEHYCVVSVKVVRGARKVDESLRRNVQMVRICRSCGAHGEMSYNEENGSYSSSSSFASVPGCGCAAVDGAGLDSCLEGPLWVGHIFDVDAVDSIAHMAHLKEAEHTISKKTRKMLDTIKKEASVQRKGGMFYRRPKSTKDGKTPKLDDVIDGLKKRGYPACRTHFDTRALRTNASPEEFDGICDEM